MDVNKHAWQTICSPQLTDWDRGYTLLWTEWSVLYQLPTNNLPTTYLWLTNDLPISYRSRFSNTLLMILSAVTCKVGLITDYKVISSICRNSCFYPKIAWHENCISVILVLFLCYGLFYFMLWFTLY